MNIDRLYARIAELEAEVARLQGQFLAATNARLRGNTEAYLSARAEAIEEAAKVAETYWVAADYDLVGIADADVCMKLCEQSATAIRALAKEPTDG